MPLFARCSKGDLKFFARHVENMEVASGRVLCRTGDEGDALFVMLQGTATVERDGRTVAVPTISAKLLADLADLASRVRDAGDPSR